jgi:ParB/Sulfiredoxin domain
VGSPYAEHVLIAELKQHREFDRSAPCSSANHGGHTKTPEALAELAASIAAEGVLEPLIVHYDPWTRRALIGEGNHRIWLAEDAGQLTVPVIATYTHGYLHGRAGPQHIVPGEPRLRPEMPHGYFPSAFRPSLVFPPWYFATPPARPVQFVDYEPCLGGR